MDQVLFAKYVTSKVVSVRLLELAHIRDTQRMMSLSKSYDVMNESYDRYRRRVLHRMLPNNKLKMLHLPKRRKGNKRRSLY